MPVELPAPIAAYIDAENRHDIGALALCFSENATVRDEGRTIQGLAAIKQWKAETAKKYRHVFVGVVQSFLKIPALHALAPTQTEPPFQITQLVTLALFVLLTIVAVVRFHPDARLAEVRA
jgi:hypothetical protein